MRLARATGVRGGRCECRPQRREDARKKKYQENIGGEARHVSRQELVMDIAGAHGGMTPLRTER